MSKRYYTVVYEITDETAFTKVATASMASMGADSSIEPGVKVVACGNGDTMTAYDALHEAVFESGQDPDEVIREFCEANDLDADATIG